MASLRFKLIHNSLTIRLAALRHFGSFALPGNANNTAFSRQFGGSELVQATLIRYAIFATRDRLPAAFCYLEPIPIAKLSSRTPEGRTPNFTHAQIIFNKSPNSFARKLGAERYN